MLTIIPGESGYFSKPTETLDPYLFEGTHLKPDVRTRLINLLLDYLDSRYRDANSWTRIWLAGSGISYQWSAARGNGDLDVLFGLDYDKFVQSNPRFAYDTREEIAEQIDADLRTNLWPSTAYISFPLTDDDLYNYNHYEVTFFLNPGVGAGKEDIMNIHPYAAYDLTQDEWTTKPAKSGSPVFQHPEEFARAADLNIQTTQAIVDRYNAVQREEAQTLPGSPYAVNAAAHKRLIVEEARNLLDSIHLGRRAAFTGNGEGYGDYYNYQWQRAKQDGLVMALNNIIGSY
jgi:hypothetical protein